MYSTLRQRMESQCACPCLSLDKRNPCLVDDSVCASGEHNLSVQGCVPPVLEPPSPVARQNVRHVILTLHQLAVN
ncbi:unnamed protein product [Chondrus crispus]|uniref:Uncharacterized protein n=1 Tax=Chondrus crispus TaxID=2769 RepID=R7QLM3_CHOCR|nr:unnamed protein product [Chondrus crispus]CDF39402.1 unnamed protein product [Chondrus crispus]|eukprot:XP_005719313.1 unnamed protein product [Chondrus crispus]